MSGSKYLLAIDQGTSSSRAVVYDRSLAVAGAAQQEFSQLYPEPGWVEHDSEEIWASVKQVCGQALAGAGATAADVAAIGITNQRETTLIWDRDTGQCVHNAIVWQDRRTAAYCDRLREIVAAGGSIKLVQIYTVARRPAESNVAPLSDAEVDGLVAQVRDTTGLAAAGFYGSRA